MATDVTGENLDFLGCGVIIPFRRDEKQDFAHATGIKLIQSSIETIFGTTCASATTYGELPFDQDLGSLVPLLRHMNLDDPALEELATFFVVDALIKGEPRVRIRGVQFVRDRSRLLFLIRLAYDIIDADDPTNRVLVPGVIQEVRLAA